MNCVNAPRWLVSRNRRLSVFPTAGFLWCRRVLREIPRYFRVNRCTCDQWITHACREKGWSALSPMVVQLSAPRPLPRNKFVVHSSSARLNGPRWHDVRVWRMTRFPKPRHIAISSKDKPSKFPTFLANFPKKIFPYKNGHDNYEQKKKMNQIGRAVFE